MQAVRWRRRSIEITAAQRAGRGLPALSRAGKSAMVLLAVVTVLTGCGAAATQTGTPAARTVRRAAYPPVAIGTGHCPLRQPAGVPASKEQSARHELAPPGVTSIELCRYGPITATGSHLQALRTLTQRSAIDAIQEMLNALPAPPTKAISCASDNGAAIWLGLAYRHAEVIESVELQGCRDVSNGSIVATASGYGEPRDRPPPLKEQLIHLIPLQRRSPAGRSALDRHHRAWAEPVIQRRLVSAMPREANGGNALHRPTSAAMQ